MPLPCYRATSGGKGNMGMFIERDRKVCAAGVPTAQATEKVADSLEHYLLKDEVDALMSDAILPQQKPRPRAPLRHPTPLDKRFAGPYGEVASIINPLKKTKFQTLVEDFKDTVYRSYWKKPLGKVSDPVPMLPEGFDIINTTFGKKTVSNERLYDICMPKEPLPDKTPHSKKPGVQLDRGYCSPPYRSDVTYGYRTFVDKRGKYGKCCLTDDKIINGTGNRTVINSIQADFQDAKQPRVGAVLAPYDNILEVPPGYAFGILKPPDNLPECLTFCDINPGQAFFRKCFSHLNSLRKVLSKKFLPTFFRGFYLNLKYFDKENTGWLPKDVVYEFCGTKHIRFDPKLIEPLLSMWNAVDGNKIEYKTFVHVINYREPSPEIPKIMDVPEECLDFRTTYSEMVKPDQPPDKRRMAGIPSGRYFDKDYPVTPNNCCKAHRTCLPHESDMKSCVNPSVLTLLHVNHRDMYEKREPNVVRKVFEAAGETFTDESFDKTWDEAKKYHSQGWVCFETFRRALYGPVEPIKKLGF